MNQLDFAAIDTFIAEQRRQGPSAISAIKAVRERFNVNLAIAKRLVEEHPAWFSVVEKNRPFQEAVEKIFAEFDGGKSQGLSPIVERND